MFWFGKNKHFKIKVLSKVSKILLHNKIFCLICDNQFTIMIFMIVFHITVFIMGQIFCSRGRPVEQFYWTSSRFQGTSNRNSTGRPVEIFIAFLDEISNSKTFEANLQNSSRRPAGRPVESRGRPIEVLQDVIQSRRFGPIYLKME